MQRTRAWVATVVLALIIVSMSALALLSVHHPERRLHIYIFALAICCGPLGAVVGRLWVKVKQAAQAQAPSATGP